MKSSHHAIDLAYRWLPLLPIIGLLGLFSYAGVQRTRNQQRFEITLEELLGESRSELNAATIANSGASKEHTEVWLRILAATEGLNGRYQHFVFVIGDSPDGQRVVPPNEDFVLEPIIAAYARDAKPILDAMAPLLESSEPIWVPTIDEGPGTLLPELQSSRDVSRLLTMELVDAFHKGENDRALFAIKMMDRLFTGSPQDTSLLIGQLVRLANLSLGLMSIEQSLQYDHWTDNELDEIERLLHRQPSATNMWKSGIRGEVAMTLDMLQSDFFGHGSQPSILPMLTIAPSTQLELAIYFRSVINDDQPAGTLRHFLWVNSSDPADAFDSRRIHSDQWLSVPMMPDVWKVAWYRSVFPAFAAALARHQAQLRLTKTVLAVRKYRRTNQRWPQTLAELVSVGLTLDESTDPMGHRIEISPTGKDDFQVSLRIYGDDDPAHELNIDFNAIVLQP